MNILFTILIRLFLSLILTIVAHYSYIDMLSDFIKDKDDPEYIHKEKMAFILCFICSFIILTILNVF